MMDFPPGVQQGRHSLARSFDRVLKFDTMPEARAADRGRSAAACMTAFLALACAACEAGRPGSSDAVAGIADFPNILVEKNVEVPMRDGVVLRADVYRPAAAGRYPTLVTRTPYGKDGLFEEGGDPMLTRGPRAGYAVVVQDVRGRYSSEGTFRPYEREGKDGHDTVEWAATRPWSDGKVGMFGQSYRGAVQWLAAMEAPPHLVAIFPARTFATGRHFFYLGGAFNHDWMRWIALYIAPDERRRRGLPGPATEEAAQKEWDRRKWQWEGFLPIRELPVLKDVAPWYYEWLDHPEDGSYWAFADVTAAHGRIAVPALNFSSWHDSNYAPLGAIANFNGMRRTAASPEARRGQRLILGPWDHAPPTDHGTMVGDLDFGPGATLDYPGLILKWHDRWLKGIRNGADEGPPIRLFVMGENVWRDENEWPLARARDTPYFLRSGGSANSARGDGVLTADPPREAEPPDRYVSDPLRPVLIENFEKQGPFDHAAIERRSDVLVYTTAPLEADVEVTGPVVVHLWTASSAPDTDFALMLCDVHKDGRAYNVIPLEAGYRRARYRDSESSPSFLTPGQPGEIVISGMVTSNLFRRGHRIRLLVASTRFPTFDRNPNTGDPPGAAARLVPARQTVLHDAAHPSRVILPIIPRG
jgi:hypothetical protein